jgi:DNA-binding XRE family transcriptional regulator
VIYNPLVVVVRHHGRASTAARKQPGTTIGRVPRATVVVAQSLQWRRSQAGLLQRELAERAGIDRATVQRAERGKPVRLDIIRKLAEALGTTPAELQAPQPTT